MNYWAELAEGILTTGADPLRVDGVQLVHRLQGSGPLQCERHPLGFSHIELTPLLPAHIGCRLRLHYWPEVDLRHDGLGSLHDHSWDLASCVLTGELEDTVYETREEESGEWWATRVRYADSGNAFIPAGRFAVKISRTRVVSSGECYYLPSRCVHSSRVAHAPAVTLIVTRDDAYAKLCGPLVLSRGAVGAETGTRFRERCDWRATLAEVEEAIGGAPWATTVL